MARCPRLQNTQDVSTFLALLIRQTYRGTIDPGKAGRLGYLCNILIGALEKGDLEKRIADLESRAAQS